MTDKAISSRNYWALASFWCGLLGFLLSLTAPIPFIPIISFFSLPLGLAALLVGWVGRNRAKVANDRAATHQIQWGIGLGCVGWLIQILTLIITFLIVAGLLVTLFGSFINYLQSTPAP
jgi:hypothetical protein